MQFVVCNLLHATNCMQQIACNCFRIWAGLSLSISVWLVTSYPKCRLTKSYCYYHVIPPNALIGCNTYGLTNIFKHVWKPAIIACNNCSALHAINCTCNHCFRWMRLTWWHAYVRYGLCLGQQVPVPTQPTYTRRASMQVRVEWLDYCKSTVDRPTVCARS